MSNLFKDYKVGLKFDLSYHGRECLKPKQTFESKNINLKVAFKDNDFRRCIKKLTFTERKP